MTNSNLVIEVCVDSVESSIAAQQGGANRVELCDNLMEGGTTPSLGTIAVAMKELNIAVNVIIRPRGGDFCYSDIEFEIMKRDIELCKQLGVNGVVIGILTPDGDIDVERSRELIELARPLSVTYHRAFDMARDPYQALEDLIGLGVDRILTTGQEGTPIEGLDLITELVQLAGDRVIIMPGSANERNINKIVGQSGAREVHIRLTKTVDSPMRYRNARPFMGGELRMPEYERVEIDAARVAQLRSNSGI